MEARHAGKRVRIGSKCLRPVVSSQHADVVADAAHEFGHASHRRFAHLHMEIADLQMCRSSTFAELLKPRQ